MKSIIITGATSGIGYECALHLAKVARSNPIIIAARDADRAHKAIAHIARKTGHQHLQFMALDLASLASIRRFRDEIASKGIEVGYLINNAGMQTVEKTQYTADGFEETFGVNHLGTLYLTLVLLPYVSADARITFTASGTHDPKQTTGMPVPELKDARSLAYPAASDKTLIQLGQVRYTTSKLCNVLTTYELQRRLQDTNIHVNAFDPGFVPGTGLARTYSPFLRFISGYVFKALILFHHNVNTASTSGARLARVAFDPKYSSVKGKYFEGEKEIPSSEDSYNEKFQRMLWDSSMELLQVDAAETTVLR